MQAKKAAEVPRIIVFISYFLYPDSAIVLFLKKAFLGLAVSRRVA
jgi:hypothetical protein